MYLYKRKDYVLFRLFLHATFYYIYSGTFHTAGQACRGSGVACNFGEPCPDVWHLKLVAENNGAALPEVIQTPRPFIVGIINDYSTACKPPFRESNGRATQIFTNLRSKLPSSQSRDWQPRRGSVLKWRVAVGLRALQPRRQITSHMTVIFFGLPITSLLVCRPARLAQQARAKTVSTVVTTNRKNGSMNGAKGKTSRQC